MKVILQKDVSNLGDAGDIKEVASGFARNYLIPRKLAVAARAGSTKNALHQKRMIEVRRAKRIAEMKEVAGNLSSAGKIEISMRVGADNKLYGSVTPHMIAQALSARGFVVDKRKIEISEPIRSLGESQVKIKLAENNTVPLTVLVTGIADETQAHEEVPVAPEQESPEQE
jgi:large subunit ribosomal protein L9